MGLTSRIWRDQRDSDSEVSHRPSQLGMAVFHEEYHWLHRAGGRMACTRDGVSRPIVWLLVFEGDEIHVDEIGKRTVRKGK